MLREFFEFSAQDLKNPRTYLLILGLGLLIAYNYKVDLEDTVLAFYENSWKGILLFFILFAGAYWVALLFLKSTKDLKIIFSNQKFWLYFVSVFLFIAIYQACNLFVIFNKGYSSDYFTAKLDNRLNSLFFYSLMIIILGIMIGKSAYKLFGLLQFRFRVKIYFYFLLAMIPLIAWASTQPEFLQQYPNLSYHRIPQNEYLSKFLVFEPFYLLDFIGVEWLFRGFIIMAFMKFMNRDTVILAASVYCIFHFGKPMLECISSFFGGYILGYMSYKSSTIWGGIIVHMGIALMMDVFALIQFIY